MSDTKAMQIARACAAGNSMEWAKLSSLMCWDAVLHCAFLANIIDGPTQLRIRSNHAGNALASMADAEVRGPTQMSAVPGGHALGFFSDGVIIHAMLSVGGGRACGNKNDCVGVGHSVGWEELDLATGLSWSGGGGIDAPLGINPKTGERMTRSVRLFHRSLNLLTR